MEKAALYLRLSKEDINKADDNYSKSIENQKKLLIDFCCRNNYDVYDIFVDDDFSGLFIERPAFLNMLKKAQEGCFSIVIAKSQSRLSRNMEHSEYLMHDLFPSIGIRFIGVVDGVDSSEKYTKKSRQINALINEWYSEDLSESIRAVYKSKMLDGDYLGAYAPYGYKKSENNRYKLDIDNNAAKWVRAIFLWYIEGKSIKQIVTLLYYLNVPTPLEYRKGLIKSQKRWSESSIKKILNNKMYTGCVIQGKSHRKSFKDKTIIYNPKDEWIVVDNMHEAIVTKEEFELVQRLKVAKKDTTHMCVEY